MDDVHIQWGQQEKARRLCQAPSLLLYILRSTWCSLPENCKMELLEKDSNFFVYSLPFLSMSSASMYSTNLKLKIMEFFFSRKFPKAQLEFAMPAALYLAFAFVWSIISNLEMFQSVGKVVCRLYTIAMQFHMWVLSILGVWYCWGGSGWRLELVVCRYWRMTVMSTVFFPFFVKCVCHLQKRQGYAMLVEDTGMEWGAGSDGSAT